MTFLDSKSSKFHCCSTSAVVIGLLQQLSFGYHSWRATLSSACSQHCTARIVTCTKKGQSICFFSFFLFSLYFYKCIVPWDFSNGKFRLLSPGNASCSSHATQPMVHAGCSSFHNLLNSDMDYRVFIVIVHHIISVLRGPYWLHVKELINYKVLSLEYSCLCGTTPQYPKVHIPNYEPARPLSSSPKPHLPIPSMDERHMKKQFGFWAFSNSVPRLWNSFLQTLRKCSSSTVFHRQLKAHLFPADCWTDALTTSAYLLFLSSSLVFPLGSPFLQCLFGTIDAPWAWLAHGHWALYKSTVIVINKSSQISSEALQQNADLCENNNTEVYERLAILKVLNNIIFSCCIRASYSMLLTMDKISKQSYYDSAKTGQSTRRRDKGHAGIHQGKHQMRQRSSF